MNNKMVRTAGIFIATLFLVSLAAAQAGTPWPTPTVNIAMRNVITATNVATPIHPKSHGLTWSLTRGADNTLPTASAHPANSLSRLSASIAGVKVQSSLLWLLRSALDHMPAPIPARYPAPRHVVSTLAGRSTGTPRISAWN